MLKAGENILAIKLGAWSPRTGMAPQGEDGKDFQHRMARLEKISAYLAPEVVRYTRGLYLDAPYPFDDPFRYMRW